MSAIRVQGLSVELGRRPVLSGVDFEARPGELVGLIGPNGAGKSTLLRAILGLVARRAGEISIGGAPLEALKPFELAKSVAYLPQSPAIHWPVTVERLVALGRLPHLDAWHRPGADDAAAIRRALVATGTAGLARRTVLTLPGGERARVLLARAVAGQAPRLLADAEECQRTTDVVVGGVGRPGRREEEEVVCSCGGRRRPNRLLVPARHRADPAVQA